MVMNSEVKMGDADHFLEMTFAEIGVVDLDWRYFHGEIQVDFLVRSI